MSTTEPEALPSEPPIPSATLEAAAPDAAPHAPPPDGARPGAARPPSVLDDSIAPLSRPLPPWFGLALAVVATACLVAAAFSHRWLANRHLGNFGFSPLSLEQCLDTCTTTSNFQVIKIANEYSSDDARVSLAFPVTGVLTFVVLLVAAAGLAASAGLAAAGKRPDLRVSPTTIALLALMIGLISGCVFIATKPGGVGAVGVAWGFWAFGVGTVAGIAGAQLLAKQIRPVDPDLLHDAMNPEQF